MPEPSTFARCRVAVIWIDWYAYHVARFRGLAAAMPGEVAGIELVGGIGVHAGLKFREELPADLPIETLLPNESWRSASQLHIASLLWQRLSALNPESVLVPGYYTLPAIAAALWARVHGVPSILMTESCAHDHARTGWKELLKSLAIRVLFNWAVTGGSAHVDYLRQLGFPADRIAGFYDVVDNELFSQGTSTLRADSTVSPRFLGLPDSPYLLYVGRLAREKNVYSLLASWNDYRKAGGTWPLVLVGDGPEAARLRAAVLECAHPEDVYFPGLKSSRELLPYYSFAGCFVLPSTREPWGLVVNEAMAAALPVLVSERCGCAPDLVQAGVNGYLFDPTNGPALTALLRRFEQLGRDRHQEMASASSEIIRGFSPQRFGHSIAAITSPNSRSGSLRAVRSTSGGTL